MLLLSACTTPQDAFPSLAKRPFESNVPVAAPEQPVAVTAEFLPLALSSKIAALMGRHGAAQTAFAGRLGAVRARVASAAGATTGSENWVDAHLQLSRLDHLRGDSVAVLAELDKMVAAQGDAESQGASPLLSPLMEPTRQSVADAVTAQSAEIDQLARQIGF